MAGSEPRGSHADCHRQLADALDDVQALLNLIALLPYAVRVDHVAERVAGRVPTQRRPVDLWPARSAPAGAPARPNTTWGTRSNR